MAHIASTTCCFNPFISGADNASGTGNCRGSLSFKRLFFIPRNATPLFIPKAISQSSKKNNSDKPISSFPCKSSREKEAVLRNFSRRSKDESPFSKAMDYCARSKSQQSQSTAFKSSSGQREATKAFLVDSKEQQDLHIEDCTFVKCWWSIDEFSVLSPNSEVRLLDFLVANIFIIYRRCCITSSLLQLCKKVDFRRFCSDCVFS